MILCSCENSFEKPSAIQEMALPMCLRSPPENLLAQAQSGSGKTAAFCLAGLCRVDTRLAMPQVKGKGEESVPEGVVMYFAELGSRFTVPLRDS